MRTLTEQYRSVKEGKGPKDVFLKEAKRQFPNLVTNRATFKEASTILKQKGIISENFVGMPMVGNPIEREKESYETAFANFLAEAEAKAEEKKVTKEVEDIDENNYDYEDKKDPNNMIFGQIQMGYYFEMKQEKNADKTIDEIKDIVFKNLAKDPIYYTKNGQFGVEVGYTDDNVALGEPIEAKGEYKSSGYGKIKENKILKESINESEALSPEKASSLAVKAIDKMEDSRGLEKIADKIAKDPKASKQLMTMLDKMNLNLNESEVDVNPMDAKKIALAFAKKAEKDKKVDENNVGGAAALGLFGGGFLAQHLAGLNDVITPIMKATGGSPSHMGAALLGAATGAALLVLGKMVYDKRKNESYSPLNEIAIAGGLVTGGGFSSANYKDFFGLNEVSDDIEKVTTGLDTVIDKSGEATDALQDLGDVKLEEDMDAPVHIEALVDASEAAYDAGMSTDEILEFIEQHLGLKMR
jgi:hypothetical protein